MKAKIESDGFNIWTPLQEHAEEKLQKITELEPINVKLLLKEGDGEHSNKKAEIFVKIPGHDIYAENTSDSFEGSINKVVSKARKQILKITDKKRDKKRERVA